ncbi:ywpJ [Symbiodinium necroappetens]|uniref:YwpJ protein n=1 Tax=Symbiodinium necroappetens TaxID=1628268 RepID=A0A813B201_9DINO|nr:ywpJ [Symbiodinium necroappetens]
MLYMNPEMLEVSRSSLVIASPATILSSEQRAPGRSPDAATFQEILRFHDSCIRAEAEVSAASAQSFFDFDDLPPAGVSEHIADSLQPQEPRLEDAEPKPAEVETEPRAAEKPRALQGHGLFVSKELGQKLAMLEHEETPPDSPGDLHGPLDEKSALALLRGRADPNAALGALRRTPLFAAAERCNIKLIDNLLKFRADVNRADLAGETPLFALCHAAAWADASLRSRRAAVQRLLEGEADIDFANPRGRTPLHAAITSGDIAVLSVLLEDTANVNARDLGGFTALMWAAGRGNAEVVKALLTARANTASAANRGETAMLFALTNKCESVVQTLQNHADQQPREGKAAGAATLAHCRHGDPEPAAFMGQVRAKFAPDLSSHSYAEKPTGHRVLEACLPKCHNASRRSVLSHQAFRRHSTMVHYSEQCPKSTWTFAEDPVVGHEMQGHWGNPCSSLKRTPHAMPNGFRPDVMLWRLVLRVDNVEDDSISLRVAARQARMEPGKWSNPALGMDRASKLLANHVQEDLKLAAGAREIVMKASSGWDWPPLQWRHHSSAGLYRFLRNAVQKAYARLDQQVWTPVSTAVQAPRSLLYGKKMQAEGKHDDHLRCPALSLPIAAPSPELDDIEAHQSDQTGTDVWDPGIVLASALPQLLPGSERNLELLELGAGLGLLGFVAALLGHSCTSTDLEAVHASSEKFAAECAELPALTGCCWQWKVLDWSEPPDWVLERTWDILLGADLLWYAVGHDVNPAPRSWAARLQTPLLRFLSRLRFTEFLLAERERDLEATEEFFQVLDLFGFEARRVDLPGGKCGSLTEAVDVAIWSIRHSCLMTVPAAIWSRDTVTNEDSVFNFPVPGLPETVRACQSLQSDELGAVVWDAAVLLAWFLCQNDWLCHNARILELGAGTGLVGLVAKALGAEGGLLSDLPMLVPLLEDSISLNAAWVEDMAAISLDWEDPHCVKDIRDIFQPQLLLLAADVVHQRVPYLALLETIRYICDLRSPKATRLLLAHQDRQPEHTDRFLEAALEQGFSSRVVARHANEKTCLAKLGIEDLHAQLERAGTAYFLFSEEAFGVHNICWLRVARCIGDDDSSWSNFATQMSRRGTWRAVALDLDGTTLNSSHTLSARTVDAIQKIESRLFRDVAVQMHQEPLVPIASETSNLSAIGQKPKVHVIIATGRPVLSLQAQAPPYVTELGLTRPVPTVCFNGACATLVDPWGEGQRVLISRGLSHSATESSSTAALDGSLVHHSRSTWHLGGAVPRLNRKTEIHEEWLQSFEELEGMEQERVEDLWELLETETPLKVVALAENPAAQAAKARAMLPPGAAHVVAAEQHVEFLSVDVSKGDTLRRLCTEHLGIPMEEVIAFGDNFNDIEMLQLAGQGVAMQNAREELKEVASRVSEWTNDDEGVARELEQLLASFAE